MQSEVVKYISHISHVGGSLNNQLWEQSIVAGSQRPPEKPQVLALIWADCHYLNFAGQIPSMFMPVRDG